MKTMLTVASALALAIAPLAFSADEAAPAKGCGMMKPAAAPAPAPKCCCCEKMMGAKAAAPTLDELLAKAKDAKGDDLLDALAAVLNKMIAERKGAAPSTTPAAPAPAPEAPPAGHQH